MANSKIAGRGICTLAVSCLAVVCGNGPAFAQAAEDKKEAAAEAMLSGSAGPLPVVETPGVAPVRQAAAGTSSGKAADSPAEKPADYWVPTLFGSMGGLRPALSSHGVTLRLT